MRAELEQVYRQHRQTLFSLALTVTGCSGLAEDAVHDAFLRLYKRGERPSGSLVAYVFAAVRNSSIDCRRRQQRQDAIAESIFAETRNAQKVPTAACESNDIQVRISAAIDDLDENVREIIVMKIFGELTFDEIGEVLATSAATVATRYRRALLKLEEQLRKNP